jgi:hypothetical protein
MNKRRTTPGQAVLAFTGSLTYADEYGISAMHVSDVSDQFLDNNGFANSGTSE